MKPLCIAIAPYLPKGSDYYFRPSDKFYFELDLWETDFEDPLETYTKISDLRFAIDCGFDLKKHVMDYLNSLPIVPGYLEPVHSAFKRYIKFLRTGNGKYEYTVAHADWALSHLGTEDLVDLFCKEVMVCLPLGSVPHWDYIYLIQARYDKEITDEEYYTICTNPTNCYLQKMIELEK